LKSPKYFQLKKMHYNFLEIMQLLYITIFRTTYTLQIFQSVQVRVSTLYMEEINQIILNLFEIYMNNVSSKKKHHA